jgi:hypothetical protein
VTKQLILLTGIPGTGKTTVARYLVQQQGFTHFDREVFDQWPRYLRTLWIRALPLFVALITLRYRRVVISWGFLPAIDNIEIRRLIEMGFVMVWFDGEREVARREFLRRGTVSEEEFDVQVSRIEQLHLETFPHLKLDPFGPDRQFLPTETIVERILAAVK